jgi:hypothetical protein
MPSIMSRFRAPRSRLHRTVRAISALAGLLVIGCTAEERPEANFILITADRISADRLDCFGGPLGAGESLCRLGEGGTLSAWAFAGTSDLATNAATLLTGLPPERHGVRTERPTFLADEHVTLAESFSAAGYATAAFVESPALNRSRRLGQGFDHYDDRIFDGSDLAPRIQGWIEKARAPFFMWIQLEEGTRLDEIDRLVARLDAVLASDTPRAGVLFTSLRGATTDASGIGLSTHRVPMIFRASDSPVGSERSAISVDLMTLEWVESTLSSVYRDPNGKTPEAPAGDGSIASERERTKGIPEADRFLLLTGALNDEEVGLVSSDAVYVRNKSALDAIGQPLPSTELGAHQARFILLPHESGLLSGSAVLPDLDWRHDILSADSPVPRLEFHLARRLRESR